MSNNNTEANTSKQNQEYVQSTFSAKDRWPFLVKRASKPKPPVENTERFALYDLQSFSKLCPASAPSNRYVRTAGYVNITTKTFYLASSRDNVNNIRIKVEFSDFDDYPEPGTFIEVFGVMYFETVNDALSLPYIQMYFFRQLKGSYSEYVELIDKLKNI